MVGTWKTTFLLETVTFQGRTVKLREGKPFFCSPLHPILKKDTFFWMQKKRHQPIFKNNKHQTWRAWCHYWRKPFWPRYMLHPKGAFQIPPVFLGVVGVGGGVLFQCFFVVFHLIFVGKIFFWQHDPKLGLQLFIKRWPFGYSAWQQLYDAEISL